MLKYSTRTIILAALVLIFGLVGCFPRTTVSANEVPSVFFSPSYPYAQQFHRYSSFEDYLKDKQWIVDNSTELIDFWNKHGEAILGKIAEYSGFPWKEKSIAVWLLRYGKTFSSPLTLALDSPLFSRSQENISQTDQIIAVLCHEFVHRNIGQDMLLNAKSPEEKSTRWVPKHLHPMLRDGKYTLHVCVNLMVIRVLSDVMGREYTERVTGGKYRELYKSWDFMMKEVMPKWKLSKDKPLKYWLELEGKKSELVLKAVDMEKKCKGNELLFYKYESDAMDYWRKEDYESAAPLFCKALAIYPDAVSTRSRLAYCYNKMARYDDAIKEYKEVLKKDPNEQYANLQLGLIYYGRDKKTALKYFEEYLRRHSKTRTSSLAKQKIAQIHADWGSNLKKEGENEKAIGEFENAISFDNNLAFAHLQLGLLYSESEKDRARIELSKYLELEPKGEFAGLAVEKMKTLGTGTMAPITNSPLPIEAH